LRAAVSARGRSVGGLVVLVTLLGVVGTLVVSALGQASFAAEPQASGAVRGRGADLYLANCASCHGPQGEGATAGPPLVGVGAASVDFYLSTGRMPLGAPDQRAQRQEPIFDGEEIAALVAYVVSLGGDGPDIPQVRDSSDLRRGWELYTANCAACHAATGSGNAVGGGFVAVGLGEATPTQIAEAMLVGPGAMPQFAFEGDDRDAIIAYVDFLRESPSPGGVPIGGFGPVAEGFVAVVVGLVAVTLLAAFVGRRSHGGEPDQPLPGPGRAGPPLPAPDEPS
jgi:ubiquinol-cytochrome c reductase cytochrome c subunit